MQFIKKRKGLTILILLALLLVAYTVVGAVRSLYLESTLIKVGLPARGDRTGTVRVVQVSDLHLAVFGEKNQELVDLVASKKPDIILATGDMIDKRAKSMDDTIDLFRRFLQIAPVVYSLGNHEVERDDVVQLMRSLEAVGVQVVNNNAVTVNVNGMALRIGGVYVAEHLYLLDSDGSLDILLCHFPEKIDVFAAYGVPLTFAGHTHGGQFRLPLLDIPLYAPGQGLFPTYTKGLYEEGGSSMIVSRGLGNSSFPFRVYNPPEIVVADITWTAQQ